LLQKLLADRFKLKFHRETHVIDGFALVVEKNGPKIREAKDDEEEKVSLGMAGAQDVADVKKALGGDPGARPLLMTLSAQKVSMARLAQLLQAFVRGHIVDQTNLMGFYNAKLVAESGQAPSGPIQEQLGLKLEPRKGPVEFLVIDYAEKPAAN
jgi:uncharacterized protein (TIGR03435 family)